MQDISRQLGVAVRWLPLILICAVGASALAYSYFGGQPKVYESTSHLIVDPGPGAETVADRTAAAVAAVGYASIAGSLPFGTTMIADLGLEESPRDFAERISTEIDDESLILSIAARSGEAQQARRIAYRVGEALISEVRRDLITPEVRDADAAIERNERLIRQLNRRRTNLQQKPNKTFEEQVLLQNLPSQIASLEESILQLRSFSSANVRNRLEWFEEPRVPASPIEPRPLYWALLAFVAGGILAVSIAFVVEYLRVIGKVREERDLELVTGQATLGTVFETGRDARQPSAERLVMLHYPRSDEAESYRGLLARIGFSGGAARTLMVASSNGTEARSLVAANIAAAFAEAGRNTILVDADYRSPHIHSFFGVRNDRGLTSILADSNVPLGWATVPTAHPRLGLMPSGPRPPEDAEPLGSRQLNALLRRLLQAADVVIFDSPPIESNLDAAVLANELPALLVVPGGSSEDSVDLATQTLQQAEPEFIGAVLYRRTRSSRKGARAKIAAAPQGWGPTWPMMYEPPARIPAAVDSATTHSPASRPPILPSHAAGLPRQQQTGQPAPAGPSTPHQHDGRAVMPPSATGPYSVAFRAPPASGQPASTARGTTAKAPAQGSSDPRVAIPVQPEEFHDETGTAPAPGTNGRSASASPGPARIHSESVPG